MCMHADASMLYIYIYIYKKRMEVGNDDDVGLIRGAYLFLFIG